MPSPPVLRAAWILGLLPAVGSFAIDLDLATTPSITAYLRADAASTQFTLMAFFIAFGFGHLVYGPWSDQVGIEIAKIEYVTLLRKEVA